jgi:hypothetical protein
MRSMVFYFRVFSFSKNKKLPRSAWLGEFFYGPKFRRDDGSKELD